MARTTTRRSCTRRRSGRSPTSRADAPRRAVVGRPRRVPRVGPGEAAADADRQAAAYNRSRLRTVVVAALPTNTRLAALPGNVFVPAATAGLDQDSVVNVTQ